MGTVRVEYIGPKPEHQDHLYGTGLVWSGRGAQHDVSESAWEGMAKHTDVYALAKKPAAPQVVVEPVEPAPSLGSGRRSADIEGLAELLACATDEQMHAFSARHGLKVDGRKRGEGLRAALAALLNKQE
jgi:tRNA(Ile2) C34 agmatinyltransferase TiaS